MIILSFTLEDEVLGDGPKSRIRELKKAVQKGNARERIAATMTLLKLCESESSISEVRTWTHLSSGVPIRTYLCEINLLDTFVSQLKREGSALLAAYALVTCLKHGEWNHVRSQSHSSKLY